MDYLQGDGRSVQQNYDNAYRRAEQHMDSAARSVTSERSSPTKPYPSRPRTRVSAIQDAKQGNWHLMEGSRSQKYDAYISFRNSTVKFVYR